MAKQQLLTRYLEKEVNEVKIMAGVALGFGGLNTLSITGSGINFPKNGIFRGIISKPRLPGQPAALELTLMDIHRCISTDIQPVLNWCDQEYTQLSAIELESDNSEKVVLTVSAAYEMCNQFRDTLKPAFKKLAQRILEIAEELNSIDVLGQIETKIKEVIGKIEEVKTNYVSKEELSKDDKIDITVIVDKENNNIIFEAEDTLNDGLIVFKIFAGAMIS